MSLLRSEMRIYYILTVVISGALSAGLVSGSLKARLYETPDVNELLKVLVPLAVCEMVLFGIAVWILTEWNIRRIEKKVCEV